MLSKLQHAYKSPGGLVKTLGPVCLKVSYSVCLKWDSRMCISNQSPVNAKVAGPGSTL